MRKYISIDEQEKEMAKLKKGMRPGLETGIRALAESERSEDKTTWHYLVDDGSCGLTFTEAVVSTLQEEEFLAALPAKLAKSLCTLRLDQEKLKAALLRGELTQSQMKPFLSDKLSTRLLPVRKKVGE